MHLESLICSFFKCRYFSLPTNTLKRWWWNKLPWKQISRRCVRSTWKPCSETFDSGMLQSLLDKGEERKNWLNGGICAEIRNSELTVPCSINRAILTLAWAGAAAPTSSQSVTEACLGSAALNPIPAPAGTGKCALNRKGANRAGEWGGEGAMRKDWDQKGERTRRGLLCHILTLAPGPGSPTHASWIWTCYIAVMYQTNPIRWLEFYPG